jgi:WD40 repeat protein
MRVGRIWSTNFISDSKVAIGLGPTLEPIQIYDITPNGLTAEPIRKINLNSSHSVESGHAARPYNTSVYPIIPIPTQSHGGSTEGVFLSGGYDGLVRLHDLRSPHDFETIFWDVTNDSAVYSLACQGLERFVAGSSMHSMLKVFDLRFPGSHAYHTIPIPSATSSRSRRQDYTYSAVIDRIQDTSMKPVTSGWNVFLSPRNSSRGGVNRHPYRPGPRNEDSPVYSLSIPSPTSANIYAGLEGAVQNLNFVSVLDAHPDPLISYARDTLPEQEQHDIKKMYNPYNDVLNLGMYEQGSEEGLGMQLLIQDDISSELAKNENRMAFAKRKGLDERWKDPSEEADKWVRGQVPQGNANTNTTRRGGQSGRGRGRGRGGRGQAHRGG